MKRRRAMNKYETVLNLFYYLITYCKIILLKYKLCIINCSPLHTLYLNNAMQCNAGIVGSSGSRGIRGGDLGQGGQRIQGPGQGHTIVIICLLFYFVILLLLFTYCYNLPIVRFCHYIVLLL